MPWTCPWRRRRAPTRKHADARSARRLCSCTRTGSRRLAQRPPTTNSSLLFTHMRRDPVLGSERVCRRHSEAPARAVRFALTPLPSSLTGPLLPAKATSVRRRALRALSRRPRRRRGLARRVRAARCPRPLLATGSASAASITQKFHLFLHRRDGDEEADDGRPGRNHRRAPDLDLDDLPWLRKHKQTARAGADACFAVASLPCRFRQPTNDTLRAVRSLAARCRWRPLSATATCGGASWPPCPSRTRAPSSRTRTSSPRAQARPRFTDTHAYRIRHDTRRGRCRM